MIRDDASQGGGVVRLFHREKECYVSAEGSFAESGVVVEDGKIISCTTMPFNKLHSCSSALSKASL